MALAAIAAQLAPVVIGALMQHFGKSKPQQTTQLPQLSPEQQQLQSQVGQVGLEGLQDPTGGFGDIAQQAQHRFDTQTAPSIAERFAGLGATRSSAFPAALAGAGRELQGDLAAQQQQFGAQNRASFGGLAQLGLGQQFSNIFQPEERGFAQGLGQKTFGAGLEGLIGTLGQQFGGQQQQGNTTRSRALEAFKQSQLRGGR